MHTIMNHPNYALQIAAALFALVAFAASALADIFQWEYINPVDPSQGKRQSTKLAPDGADIDAVPGAALAYRNLTMAYLVGADLSDAYGVGTNLTNADLSQAKLTRARFSEVTLTDADFTDARISCADFSIRYHNIIPGVVEFSAGTGIAPAQIYSTASYQARDLIGINLELNDLGGANFTGQNLANANFGAAALTGTDFRGANLANTDFAVASQCHPVGCGISRFAALTNADLTAADARGANLDPSGAITSNLIQPNGHINGLDLQADGLLVVRDYDGPTWNPALPIPIKVDQHLAMGRGGTLRMVFEADAWDSTISFAPGIPVTLGGTLELAFAADVNLARQVGRTLDLFDWTSVNPTGAFGVSSPYAWDLTNLYTTGEVTLTSVPEPASIALAAAGVFGLTFYRRRRIP